MAEYLIQDTTLTGIADAIRGKTGGTDPVAVSDMAAQIEGIQAGGGDDVLNALIDRSITEISSNTTSIGSYAFQNCSTLTTANFPAATSIDYNAFQNCSSLTTADFPVVKSIGNYVFQNCSALTTANFHAATSIGSDAFYGCSALTTADFHAVTSIANRAFYGCSALTTLILRSETTAKLFNTNAFSSNTPIASGTAYIYVPAALIEDYKVAYGWSTYAAQFRALEDYTVDGTTTGELDPTKTGT